MHRERTSAHGDPKWAFHGLVLLALLAPWTPGAARADALLRIEKDTVWKGLVELSGAVCVEEGATLLLLPGTRIRFARPENGDAQTMRLDVKGELVAQGTPAEPIVFTSAAPEPRVGDWGGISFEGGNGRLRQCRIEYAQTALQASSSTLGATECVLRHNKVALHVGVKVDGEIFDCEVSDNDAGLYFSQSAGFLVEKCRINRTERAAILCINGSSPRISNCEIMEGRGDGIACVDGSSPRIEGNLIAGHQRGIFVQLKSEPLIARNEIRENETGLWMQKAVAPKVLGNLISRNDVGVYCNFSAYPELHGNNIFDNRKMALRLGDQQSIQVERRIPFRSQGQFYTEAPSAPESLPPQTRKFAPFKRNEEGLVDARGNWWGKDVSAEMKTKGDKGNIGAIDDGADQPETDYLGEKVPRDRVAFAPWEERPVSDAGRQEIKYPTLRGKVVFGGKPLGGVRLHVFRGPDEGFRGEGFGYALTAPDGTFSLPLRPGRYSLVAKASAPPFPRVEPGEGQLFGYYGGNPVMLAEGQTLEANIQVVKRSAVNSRREEGETALLEGVILSAKGPEEGAALYAYPDTKSDFRGPDLSGPQGSLPGGAGPDGRFSVELPPGTYYLTASKRNEGPTLGPLRPGDHYGYFDGNPVRIEAGKRVSVTIQMTEKLKEMEASRVPAVGVTAIRGMIRDPSGRPVSGVFAFASTDSQLVGSMPPFRSGRTGPDGTYRIEVPKAGIYYVGARSGYGGPPVPGQWHGVFGGDPPRPVSVEEGKAADGVDITVQRME